MNPNRLISIKKGGNMKPVILKQLKVIVCYLFTASLLYAGINEWTSNGPWKGRSNGLAINPDNPDILYVAHQAPYKTIDGGKSWNPANNGIPWNRKTLNCGVYIVPSKPDIVFAGG